MGTILGQRFNKQRRMSLIIASVLLLCALVIMVWISYAWFSIATVPEVRAVLTNVSANGNLEIALAGDQEPMTTTLADGDITDPREKNMHWGNMIDLDTEVYSEMGEIVLRPVKNENGNYSVPVYDNTGRITSLKSLSFNASQATQGIHIFSEQEITYMYAVDLWLRSNVEGTVELVSDPGTERVNGVSTTAGQGSSFTFEGTQGKLITMLRVAFADKDNNILAVAKADETGRLQIEDGGTAIKTIGPEEREKAVFVRMYVYLDGLEVTNADMPREKMSAGTLNVQFRMSEELTPIKETI